MVYWRSLLRNSCQYLKQIVVILEVGIFYLLFSMSTNVLPLIEDNSTEYIYNYQIKCHLDNNMTEINRSILDYLSFWEMEAKWWNRRCIVCNLVRTSLHQSKRFESQTIERSFGAKQKKAKGINLMCCRWSSWATEAIVITLNLLSSNKQRGFNFSQGSKNMLYRSRQYTSTIFETQSLTPKGKHIELHFPFVFCSVFHLMKSLKEKIQVNEVLIWLSNCMYVCTSCICIYMSFILDDHGHQL